MLKQEHVSSRSIEHRERTVKQQGLWGTVFCTDIPSHRWTCRIALLIGLNILKSLTFCIHLNKSQTRSTNLSNSIFKEY